MDQANNEERRRLEARHKSELYLWVRGIDPDREPVITEAMYEHFLRLRPMEVPQPKRDVDSDHE